jgi:ABC-type multidrug transport system ATPase subunit
MMLLTLDLVGKRYDTHRSALHDVTLRLGSGVWGLVGPNGAGKTTLLRILATLLVPTHGSVSWNGHDIVRQPRPLRSHLGYLPQDLGVYPLLTASEFLRYLGGLKGMGGSVLQQRIEQVLDMVNLSAAAGERLRSYSGGMIRRLGIAQALLNDPQVLILDEPTAGLDPGERVRFREVIASLQGERLVILSTHIITDVEAMATDLILLNQGRVHWTGTPGALQNDAVGTVWEVTVDLATFGHLRDTYQVSQAIRRGDRVETRLIATARPHPEATQVEPSLEEAYLYLVGAAHAGSGPGPTALTRS